MKKRLKKRQFTTIALLSAASFVAGGVADVAPAAASHFPETIDLPDPENFAGEGVATGRHDTFYAGSRVDGRIARGDLRDGHERDLHRRADRRRGDRPEGRPPP